MPESGGSLDTYEMNILEEVCSPTLHIADTMILSHFP